MENKFCFDIIECRCKDTNLPFIKGKTYQCFKISNTTSDELYIVKSNTNKSEFEVFDDIDFNYFFNLVNITDKVYSYNVKPINDNINIYR